MPQSLKVKGEFARESLPKWTVSGSYSEEYSLSSGWSSHNVHAGTCKRKRNEPLLVPAPTKGVPLRVKILASFLFPQDAGGVEDACIVKLHFASGGIRVRRLCAEDFHRVDQSGFSGFGVELFVMGVSDCEQAVQVFGVNIDVPAGEHLEGVRVETTGTSSALIYDVFFEIDTRSECPFRGQRGNISLADIGAIIRLGDRSQFHRALAQLRNALLEGEGSLDEARGQGLTFLSVVAAALLELGSTQKLHGSPLEAARKLDSLDSVLEIAEYVVTAAEHWTSETFGELGSVHDEALIRACDYLDRNFAENISDTKLAESLGLSTSHFRYLFKQMSGQPFHRYLHALRLEKGRKLVLETSFQIAEISHLTGFISPAHFTRAFQRRFGFSPSALRARQFTYIR